MNRSLITFLLCVFSAVTSLQLHAVEESPTKQPKPTVSSDLKSLIAVSDYLSYSIFKVKDRTFVVRQPKSYSPYSPEELPNYGWRDDKGITHFPNGCFSKSNKFKPLDFNKHCKKNFKPSLKKRTEQDILEERFQNMLNSRKQHITPALAAIWLHRLGDTKQAHIYWKIAIETLEALKSLDQKSQKKNKTPSDPWTSFLNQLGGNSPWSLFETAVEAHMHDKSELSLELLMRLQKISPSSLKKFGNGEQFLTDLKRRSTAKTIKQISAKKLPPEFKGLSVEKRIHFLISRLDQINQHQNGQPGGVDFANDWRVYELIRIGDPAISALIDCLETDTRLTRSYHYWRRHHQSRTVLSVREAALTAIMSILQEPLYETASTGSNFTSEEATQTKQLVKYLRDYWKEHGKTERFQRFMDRLTDPKKSIDKRFDALELLAWADHDFILGTTFSTDDARKNEKHDQHPLLNRFTEPTLAEAAWELTKESLVDIENTNLFDQDFNNQRDKDRDAKNYRFILHAIAKIKDPRITPTLIKAYKKETLDSVKLQLATTANACGNSDLITNFATTFLTGTMVYETEELADIINTMVKFRHPECEKMLDVFTNKKHGNYQAILKGLLTNKNPSKKNWNDFESKQIDWKHHPFAIKILVDQLDNKQLTGEQQQITKNGITNPDDSFSDLHNNTVLFDWLKTQKHTKKKVILRVCDIAALRLQEIISDLPWYSPLLKDRDTSLAKIKNLLESKPFSELPEKFARHLGQGEYLRRFYLELPKPMHHPATAQDLAQRKASFHFNGKGKLLPLKLPYFTYLLVDWDNPDLEDLANPIIILQTEQSPKGHILYGALSNRGLEVYHPEEIKTSKP